ncbi:hypothetical protein CU097_002044, partial [Rhizopus azygosporus]
LPGLVFFTLGLTDPTMMSAHLPSKNTTEQPINKPVAVETTCWVESDNEIYRLAFYQLEYFVGFKKLRSGNNCYLEIKFDCGALRNEIPAHTCKLGAIIKRVTLQTLSWLISDLLLEDLRLTLCNYGKIWDRGIHARTVTCAYMGNAYAALDRALESPQLELVHILP